jgi:hypothetical protein
MSISGKSIEVKMEKRWPRPGGRRLWRTIAKDLGRALLGMIKKKLWN